MKLKTCSYIVVITFFFIVSACHLDHQSKEFRRAEKYLKEKKIAQALAHYSNSIEGKGDAVSVQAARKSAHLSYFNLKRFQESLVFYRYLVLHSKSEKERVFSQEQIVSVYFDKFSNYTLALSEINRLLEMVVEGKKRVRYKLKAAKSYFYLGEFEQALVEVDSILSQSASDLYKFEVMSLKGDIYITAKKLPEAIAIYKSLQKDFPKKANSEKIGMNIAFCYEEMDELDLAIDELKKIHEKSSKPELIAMKIKRLEERKQYLPKLKTPRFRKATSGRQKI